MEFIIVTFILLVLELLYFRIADKFNIIDKPNHRSSHTQITLRGGGIIFPIVFILFFVFFTSKFNLFSDFDFEITPNKYAIFGVGILTISTISFLDDILDLSSKLRLLFHFVAVTLLIYFLGLFTSAPIWFIPLVYVFVIGVLNAYNFMDGINGITGVYSLVMLITFYYINQYGVAFTDAHFIIYPILASLVFLFFNFRKKAKCFAGDVGSMSIAFWVLALLGLLMVKTENFTYLLFIAVYGIEVISTILQRIKLKENIFEAHRHHLYQLLVNQMKWSHLLVATLYGGVQLLINACVIKFGLNFWEGTLYLILPTFIIYIYSKYYIYKITGAY